jgi:hypothetical protein
VIEFVCRATARGINVAWFAAISCLVFAHGAAPAHAREFLGNPQSYRTFLRQLGPGDTLMLAAGRYEGGLPINRLSGEPGKPIVLVLIRSSPSANRPCSERMALMVLAWHRLRHAPEHWKVARF